MEHVVSYIKIKMKLRNSASYWLLLYRYITMHGPLNVECQDIIRTRFVQILLLTRIISFHVYVLE